MNVQRGTLVSGGLQVPDEIQRALGLAEGDAVTMRVIDGELRVVPVNNALARVRAELRRYIPEGVSLSDELIADRRAEAARE